MINLASTSDKIQLLTSATGTIEVSASYVDLNGTTVSPGQSSTADITAATTTDVVAAPASSTVRNIKSLFVFNSHAIKTNTVTVKKVDATRSRTVMVASLGAGEALVYEDGAGWSRYNCYGVQMTASSSPSSTGMEPLVINITGTRTGTWALTRTVPSVIDNGDGTAMGNPYGKWVSNFGIDTQPGITTVDFRDLAGITTTFGYVSTFPNATAIGYPALTLYPGGFTYGGPYGGTNLPNLVTLDFSGLEILQGNMDVYGAAAFPVLTNWDLSSLTIATGYLAPQLPSVPIFDWSALKQCRFIVIGNCPALVTIHTPALVSLPDDSTMGSVYVHSGVGALTSWLCPSTLMQVGHGINIVGGALDQASVDSWLIRLAALDGTNGTTLYENNVVTIMGSAPSSVGLAAAAVLTGRGCTVTHN